MRKNQQSRIYYHGGDWHRATMAIAEIVAFEKGYESEDARAMFEGTGMVPDLVVVKWNAKPKRHGWTKYVSWEGTRRYAIEIVDSSEPDREPFLSLKGVDDILYIRRADVPDPDSLTAIFAHCRRRIP